MTSKQQQAYIDLLSVVEEDAIFLANMAQRISAHVTNIKDKMSKIKANMEEP